MLSSQESSRRNYPANIVCPLGCPLKDTPVDNQPKTYKVGPHRHEGVILTDF